MTRLQQWAVGVVAAAVVLAFSVAPAGAQTKKPKDLPTLLTQLEVEKAKFAEAEKMAKAKFLKNIDKQEQQLRNAQGVNVLFRAEELTRIQNQRKRFEATGKLPQTDSLLEELYNYMVELHRARKPLSDNYQNILKAAIKGKEDDLMRRIRMEKAELDKAMAGREKFTAQAHWHGSRLNLKNGNATPIHLWVGPLRADTFDGNLSQDRWDMKVKGVLDGNLIAFTTTETVRGNPRKLTLKGFVLEDRILLGLSGIAPNGGPAAVSYVLLQRQ